MSLSRAVSKRQCLKHFGSRWSLARRTSAKYRAWVIGTLAPAAASLRIAARSFASLPRHLLCPVGPLRADHYAARGALSFVARYVRRTLLSSELPLIYHLAEKSRLREPIVSPEILSRAANVFQ